MTKRNTIRCPRCGSNDTMPILYGLPGPEMFRRAYAGEIALGGCIIDPDIPTRCCRSCGHAWQHNRTVVDRLLGIRRPRREEEP